MIFSESLLEPPNDHVEVPITLENETTTPVETMKDRYRISSRLLTNR